MLNRIAAILGILLCVAVARAEDRILWYSIGDGLANTTNLQSAINFAVTNNFNGLCFLARYRADAGYIPNRDFATYSNPEPRMSSTVDGLQYAIDHGHEVGLKIYASVSCFAVAEGSDPYPSFLPSGSITYIYKGSTSDTTYAPLSGYPRAMVISDDSALWADPGRADVRTYTRNVVKDLIQNYDLDGIFFDRIRYPQDSYYHRDGAFGYNPQALTEMGLTNPGPGASAFITARQNAITTFLKDARADIQGLKPWVLVSATPVLYSNSTNSTYNYNFQHFPSWDSAPNPLHVSGYGVLDFVAPQIYKSSASDVPININLVNGQINETSRMFQAPTFSASIAATGDVLANSICSQSTLGCKGFSVFSFKAASVAGYMSTLRATATACGTDVLASVSPTTDYTGFKVNWDQVKPNNITNLAATIPQMGRVTLTWSTPAAASDGDVPTKYLVYRSSSSPVKLYYANLVNKNFDVTGNSFTDTGSTGLSAGTWYYKVIPVDEYNNKGGSNQPAGVVVSMPADYIIETGAGGKNVANFSKIAGNLAVSSAKSTAAGLTSGIGSQYSSLTYKDDVARFTPSGLTTGNNIFDVYVTIPSATNYNAPNCTWKLRLANGTVVSGLYDATPTAAGNKWLKIGTGNYTLNPTNCYLELDDLSCTNATTSDRFYVDAVKFVFISSVASGVNEWSLY